MLSVRELIKNLQIEARGDLTPGRAAEMIVELSSLLGNVNEYIKDRQMAYNKWLLPLIEVEGTVAKAKLVGETSSFYEELLDAKNAHELVIEMMRSLKYYLRIKEEEYREARF